ncbi:MAG TPA: hypothetical protein VIK86_02225 [Candidatus Paceibacterota bacterium]
MEIIEIINQKLESMGEDYGSLKPFMQEYLTNIEGLISEKTKIQERAIETLKNNTFSISSISKELGCARTTLYNHNQFLKRYIESSETIFNKSNPYVAYDNLKVSNGKLQEQISLMEDRDIVTEILKQENAEINKMLKESKIENARLHVRNLELGSELHDIKINGVSNKESKVLSLKQK